MYKKKIVAFLWQRGHTHSELREEHPRQKVRLLVPAIEGLPPSVRPAPGHLWLLQDLISFAN